MTNESIVLEGLCDHLVMIHAFEKHFNHSKEAISLDLAENFEPTLLGLTFLCAWYQLFGKHKTIEFIGHSESLSFIQNIHVFNPYYFEQKNASIIKDNLIPLLRVNKNSQKSVVDLIC